MRHPFLRTLAGATVAAPTDPNFENVTLLLHGDGTNGGQNNTFVDGSTNNFTITRNGNTTQGTFSPYGDNWSNRFDGTGDYLSIGANAAFDFGTGNFTIEAWVYIAGNSALDGNGNRPGIIFAVADSVYSASFIIDGNPSTTGTGLILYGPAYSSVAGTIAQNTWHHLAVSKSGTSVYFWLNGTQLGTTQTTSGSWGSSTKQAQIGQSLPGLYTFPLNGYISNLRVLKGTALYTSAFTPPSAPLTAITNTVLLTCQSNRFRDASTNNFTITRNGDVSVQRFSPFSPTAAYAAGTIGGSGYFDGTGDYLTVPDNATFDFGTGDFTIELWVYIAGNSALNNNSTRDVTVFGSFPTSIVGSLTNSWGFNLTGNGTTTGVGLGFSNWQSGSNSVISATVTIPQTSWNHIAVARSGTTTKLFLNGAEVGSGTLSNQTVNSGQNLAVGRLGYPGYIQELNGYISNLRVLKGAAQYTGSYTVPTAPLTAITNTSLLLNFTNAAILDNAMMAVPETVGDVKISTSVKKYGTGSLSFDGNADYLWIKNAGNLFDLSAGDFTVELWFYAMDKGDSESAESLIQQNEQTWRIYLRKLNGPRVLSYTVNGTGAFFTAGNLFNWDTWNHVAICKSGTTTTMYLNGVSVGTTTLVPAASSGPVYIGSNLVGTTVYWPMLGYIDDIRVTKGVARYTSNFTPPTAALPDL